MDTVLFSVGGLLIGIAIGLIMMSVNGRKRLRDIQDQLKTSWKDLDLAKKRNKTDQSRSQKELRETAARLSATEKELAKAKAGSGEDRGQTAALQRAEEARYQLEEQVQAGQSQLKQVEVRAHQAEQLLSDAQGRIDYLESKASQALPAQDPAANAQQVAEIQRLRSEVDNLRQGAASDQAPVSFAEIAGDLDAILSVLTEREFQDAVALADANGIVIAGVGTKAQKENLAAAAKMLTSASNELGGVIPFGKIRLFTLQDDDTGVICGGTFHCQGETLILASIGQRIPAGQVVEGAITALGAALA